MKKTMLPSDSDINRGLTPLQELFWRENIDIDKVARRCRLTSRVIYYAIRGEKMSERTRFKIMQALKEMGHKVKLEIITND